MDEVRDPFEIPLQRKPPVWVSVLLNTTSRFGPFGDSDVLRSTVGFPAAPPSDQEATIGEVLAWVFEQLNVDDPHEFFAQLYRQGRNRSLSVGDVVVVGEQAWACESQGWRAVTLNAAHTPSGPAAVVCDPQYGIAHVINGLDEDGNEITYGESVG